MMMPSFRMMPGRKAYSDENPDHICLKTELIKNSFEAILDN